MNTSVLIILSEVLLVLLVGIGFVFFMAQKKKKVRREALSSLLHKMEEGQDDRKKALYQKVIAIGVSEDKASEYVAQILDGEKACVKNFVKTQLGNDLDDISFFHESVGELSDIYLSQETFQEIGRAHV